MIVYNQALFVQLLVIYLASLGALKIISGLLRLEKPDRERYGKEEVLDGLLALLLFVIIPSVM